MGKFRRIILIALGAVLALAAIVLLGVNLYVQSKATQAKIQQELSQQLGTPLHIRRISVTPWGGLKLSGIEIPQNSTASSSQFLEAKTFRLRVRFLSLLARRLVITEVSLVDPTVVWAQNSEGKWRLPGLREKEVPVADLQAETEPAKLDESPSPSASASTTPLEPRLKAAIPKSPPKEKIGISVVPEVQRVNVKHGNFGFLDRSGGMVANFEDVNFRSSMRNAASIRGNAKIAKISLRDRFFLERMESLFSYEPDVLELSKISAHAGGGEIEGHFAMQPEAADSPFTVSVNFRNVQADQIVANAGGPKGMVQGKLEGNLEASGKTADPNGLTGQGEIFLRDGQLRQYSLLVALGQILQIEELTQLHLEQAQAKYHITPGLVTIDQLVLRSQNIRLSASGTVTLRGKLKLESQLAINEKVRGQLFKAIRENFQPTDEPGYFALDFQVGGTIDRPKTNLMDQVVGRGLKDLFNTFLGGGKPRRKKSAATARPVEEASPSPEAPVEATPPAAATEAPSPP